jgi:hypothetical protein
MLQAVLTLIAALAATTPPAAAPALAGWQAEPEMAGLQYVGRIPPDGPLMVGEWRNDGGLYVADELRALALYSNDDRVGLATEIFRLREPDGVAAWTIDRFMSFPGNRETVGVVTECGMGADFGGRTSETDLIVGVADYAAVPRDTELYTGLLAAAKVDLKTGTIEPIDPKGVYCIQMLGD